ncbi:uncharacterized protein LOC5571112 isoform X2 [Aedes aegypti]|uniref:Uncharacterized protein n=1 Tax=Aedes aegypti TaxID=7159 RepID=A0A6I8U264_AEDAE|nr:uncharacterized protein LOC5571112 isoform X2 [Aedes aegypti]
MSNINNGHPLPTSPSRPVSTTFPSGVPPPIPPRKIDYENIDFIGRTKIAYNNQTRANSVQNLMQNFQALSCDEKGTEQNYPNYLYSTQYTGSLQHIYEEVPARSSTSGSNSVEVEEYWNDSMFDTEWTDSGSRNVPFPFPCDGSQSTKRSSSKRSSTAPENAVDELIQNEQKYIDSLMNGILNFIPLIYHMNLPGGLRGQRNNLFGNVEEIHELHQDDFLPALRRCYQNVEKIAQCFIHYVETEKFYCYVKYALNRRKSDTIFERHRDYFSSNQHELNSFLLQPIQRLPRYKLFLDKFLKETLKFGDDQQTTSHVSSIQKAQEMLSDVIDLMNAAVSISDIRQCANEFAAISQFASGFSRDNDLASTLILKPKGNKLPSRNNPIDLFAQGKFIQAVETDIYDEARYRRYKAKLFIFEKLVIYTEVVKATLSYRGHYFDSEINFWDDSKKLHLFCLHRGTQEIEMRFNKSLANTVKAIRHRAISQFFNEPQLIDFEAAIEPQTAEASVTSDLDLDNNIMALINSQIQFVQILHANIEYYLECNTSYHETKIHTFREMCIRMTHLHYDRVLSDLSINVGNISAISTVFLQYVTTDFPHIYEEYLKISYKASKYIRIKSNTNTTSSFIVPTIDEFLFLPIESIIQNASTDKSLYHRLAVVQVELEKFSQSVADNFRLLCLDDRIFEYGLAVISERAKIKSERMQISNCKIFLCERAAVCVAYSDEKLLAKRNERLGNVIFCDRFAGRAHPMRLRKSRKNDDMVCFTFRNEKYKVKFQNAQIKDRFYANYIQKYVSVAKQ